MPKNGQFEYPEVGWSTGNMRMARKGAPIGDPGYPIRELEGERKRREGKISQLGGGQYETSLTPAEEAQFKQWKQKYAPNDSGEDYDLRGAFRAGLKPDPETGHWPDTYKKPNHPTFSDQSIYAKDRPDLAGRWEGDKYISPGG